jgi:hypothetical protein
MFLTEPRYDRRRDMTLPIIDPAWRQAEAPDAPDTWDYEGQEVWDEEAAEREYWEMMDEALQMRQQEAEDHGYFEAQEAEDRDLFDAEGW